jgi:hypothetical protein
MAQGDQLTGSLGAHDGRDSGDPQHIALGMTSGSNEPQGLGCHLNPALGNRYPSGLGLRAHIDHVGLSSWIEMGKAAHR